MTDLRKDARGRDCMLRLPGVCNGNAETVVHAHYRRGGVGGMGLKPPDVCGVRACSACHDVIDGRVRAYADPGELADYMLNALCRQLEEWTRREVLKW